MPTHSPVAGVLVSWRPVIVKAAPVGVGLEATVPEAIAAREAGCELLGLSVVTAVEGSDDPTDPAEVVSAAERTAAGLGPLVAALLG